MKNHNFLNEIFSFLLHFNSLYISLYKNYVLKSKFLIHQQLKKSFLNILLFQLIKQNSLWETTWSSMGQLVAVTAVKLAAVRQAAVAGYPAVRPVMKSLIASVIMRMRLQGLRILGLNQRSDIFKHFSLCVSIYRPCNLYSSK